jgi:hypothetical protein
VSTRDSISSLQLTESRPVSGTKKEPRRPVPHGPGELRSQSGAT